MNKVSAAKRRKRDRSGKFNLEDESPDSNENQISGETPQMQQDSMKDDIEKDRKGIEPA